MNVVNALTNLKLSAVPTPLVVFAAVLGAMFLFLAVPLLIAHEAPVEGQVIHACVNHKSGEIKIVDPLGDGGSKDHGRKDKGSGDSNDGCKEKDLVLDWNAVGPQGATGAAGSTGSTGATGPSDPSGPTGKTGRTGEIGPSGPPGYPGSDGLSGYVHVRSTGATTKANNSEFVVTIACPYPMDAVGGGHSVGNTGFAQVRIIDNEPWPRQALPNQWRVNSIRVSSDDTPWTLYANVICIDRP